MELAPKDAQYYFLQDVHSSIIQKSGEFQNSLNVQQTHLRQGTSIYM